MAKVFSNGFVMGVSTHKPGQKIRNVPSQRGTYAAGGPCLKKVGEAPVGQRSLNLAHTVKYSRKDEL